MDTSAISGSAKGEGIQGAVQISVLKKAQDMQVQQMQTMMQSIDAASPAHLGRNFDKTR